MEASGFMAQGDFVAQTVDTTSTEFAGPSGALMLVAMVMTLIVTFVFQRGLLRGGLPAGFMTPWRALGATILLTTFVFVGVFVPATLIGQTLDIDTASLSRLDLFSSQLIMLAVLAGWALFAFGEPLPRVPELDSTTIRDASVRDLEHADSARDPDETAEGPVETHDGATLDADPRRDWLAFFGLRTSRLRHEIRIGFVAGAAAWAAVIAVLMVTGSLVSLLPGSDEAAGAPVSPLIVFLAGLPVFWRLMLSLAAGVVEEIFFRGFLQPRMGIALSTVCFVLGHAAYGQPMMFVGLTVLSLLYAWLVRWRGNVWAAIVAHTLFDTVQLLVVVPAALTATGNGLG